MCSVADDEEPGAFIHFMFLTCFSGFFVGKKNYTGRKKVPLKTSLLGIFPVLSVCFLAANEIRINLMTSHRGGL